MASPIWWDLSFPWRLADLPEAPYKTTILRGKWDVGDCGIRFFGILWLLAGIGFGTSAALLFVSVTWWMIFTGITAVCSLVLSVLSLPEAKTGIPANLLILVVVAARHFAWF